MRIIVYAILILSLSCDSLGTNEFQASLTYHEYVGFAWQEFILKNYNTSIDYFNSAKEVALEEEEYDNSAEIGLGWVYLMRANQYMSSISSSYRDSAFNQLQYDTLETEAIFSYSQTCNYEFCCDSCFVNDKEVGNLYFSILNYLESGGFLDPILVQNIEDFITLHQPNTDNFYDFMDGKPSADNGDIFNLTTNNLILLLAQIHLRNNDLTSSCDVLKEYSLCNLSESTDCVNGSNIISILNCLEESTIQN